MGTKNNVAEGLTKTVNQLVLRNMLTTLKTELLETSKEQLSINLIVCKNKLMGAEESDAGSPVRQSKCWTQENPDAFPSGRESSDAGSLGKTRHKNIVVDYRENCKNIVMDYRENCKNIVMDYRENCTRAS